MTWTEVLKKLLEDNILLEDRSTGIIQIHPKYYSELGRSLPGNISKSNRAETLALKYIELWPKKILSGGRPVRQGLTTITKKLTVFLNQHPKITDEQILQATTRYINTKKNDWNYASCNDYFISKNNTSLLETYIENTELGTPEGSTVAPSLKNRSL